MGPGGAAFLRSLVVTSIICIALLLEKEQAEVS